MGRPGVDFPVLPKIPRTDFSCRKVKSSGYYADLDTGCQVFHICDGGRKISFLCPNGTIFRQSHLICDWWFRVDCERSVEQYEESAEQLAHDQMIYKKRAEEIARALAAKENGKINGDSGGKKLQASNGRQGKRRPQEKPNNTNNLELERQITAESASFTSNRHRFSNNLDQLSEYRSGAVTSTAQPPLLSTYPTTNSNAGKVQNYRVPNNYSGQNNFQIRVRNQQNEHATISVSQNKSLLNQDKKQASTKTNYDPYRGHELHQAQSNFRTSSKPHFDQEYGNYNNNNNQQSVLNRPASPKPELIEEYNKNYSKQQPNQYRLQTASKPVLSEDYRYNNNQQSLPNRPASPKLESNEEYNQNYSKQQPNQYRLQTASKPVLSEDYRYNNDQQSVPNKPASPKPESNEEYNQNYSKQEPNQYRLQTVSKPVLSEDYHYNNNQQQESLSSISESNNNQEFNRYKSILPQSQLQTTDGAEFSFKNSKVSSNSEYQTTAKSVQYNTNSPVKSQTVYQSTNKPQVEYSYQLNVKSNLSPEINYSQNSTPKLQLQYKTPGTSELNYDSIVNSQYNPHFQTTPQPFSKHEYQNHKTSIKPQYQYQTTPGLEINSGYNSYRSVSSQTQYQYPSTVKPTHKDGNVIKYQNDSPNLLLNDQYSRINVISPAPLFYSSSKPLENHFFLNDATSSPILANQATTALYKDLSYYDQGQPSLAQTINSLSTPEVTFTVSPQTQQTGPQSTIFTAKIKPKNKDYTYVELQRHHEASSVTTPSPSVTTPYYSVSSITPSVQPVYLTTVTNPSTPFSTTISHKNTQFTYIPNQSTTNALPNSYRPGEPPVKYASYDNSGRREEIRPELINSLVEDGIKEKTTKKAHSPDSGVTPTSAKALHSLATYYGSPESVEDSSTILNNLGGKRPQVSDVVLNFHSNSDGRSTFGDKTTISPPTSTHNHNLPSELTKQTKESYTHLFSESKEQSSNNDLIAKQSGRVIGEKTSTQIPTTSTELELTEEDLTDMNVGRQGRLRDSSELRELAQVFSRALSAYLEDPDTFKEILAQVRPTEPNIEVTTPSPEDEVLDFSDAQRGNKIRTTTAPATTLLDALIGDNKLNVGKINSLASKSKTNDQDNSIENFSYSPIAVQTFSNLIQYSTVSPTSLANDLNNVASNCSTGAVGVAKLGSSEDPTYFPTAGSVDDASRPRYGGFHNNTRRIPKNYSPYGAGLPNNVTGSPIKVVSVSTTISSPVLNRSNFNLPIPLIPEAKSVNSLLSNTNILYNNNAYSSSSEDSSDSLKDKERLLVPSSSQSLLSASNYLRLQQNIKNGNNKPLVKDAFMSAEESDSSVNDFSKEELLPYFGQQPPFENLGKPSGFQTQNPNVNTELEIVPFTNTTQNERIKPNAQFNTPSSLNYRNGKTLNNESSFDGTLTASLVTERDTELSHKNVENDLTLEEKDSSTTWTASPSLGTLRFSEGELDNPVNQTQSYLDTTTLFQATTYHPLQASSDHTTTTTNVDTTTLEPDVTYTNSEYETTVNSGRLSYQTTLSPEHPDYKNFIEEKAKEMFGMLNETTAGMLMNMMNQAESNLTIRRLVLLLVADKSKENKTPEESRSSLIRALLTEEGSNSDETTSETPTQAPSTTQTVQRKKSRIPRVRNSRRFNQGLPNLNIYSSPKFYRGTDSETAVAGSNVQSSTELNNKLNSAKLYIPSASTNTNIKLPYDSDARAVELLKTLYNLAAKWG
uniref:Chitin-binding type-2 domain-containing protein n=2 Tax=Rhodnius prolixus TaxID=13249 RepID=T1HCJ8_RHOPR